MDRGIERRTRRQNGGRKAIVQRKKGNTVKTEKKRMGGRWKIINQRRKWKGRCGMVRKSIKFEQT